MRHVRCFGILLPGLLALLLAGCNDDHTTASLPTAALQSMLDAKVAASTAVPGAVLGVSRGRSTWIGAAGTADTATHTAMQPSMRFRIGSLTKQFTAALILKLVDEGKLSLDDTVRKWLPDLALPNDDQITVRMLLNHTSGVPNFTNATFWNTEGFTHPDRAWEPHELADRVKTESFTDPGTAFSYCNTGYVLAGMIAEAAAGQSIAQAMTTRFFIPLRMRDTVFAVDGNITGAYAHGYLQLPAGVAPVDVSTWNPSYAWTAGSIISTAHDLLIWIDALFGGRVLSSSSLTAMLTPIAPATEYGFGLGFKQAVDGRNFVAHSGQIPGYFSLMAHHRESGLTIVVLTNREDIWQEPNDIVNPVYDAAVLLLP
ncbi:MAG TPA: serine hydrolase domain-containing protein [Armatimonadota bacterium]